VDIKKVRAIESPIIKKKRAPIEKLRELTEYADKRLVELGIRKPKGESVIDNIRSTKDAPMLPGLREYLPTALMINIGRRGIIDFSREWQLATKKDLFKQEKLDEFFKFVIEKLDREDTLVNKVFTEYAQNINRMLDEGLDTSDKTIGEWLKPIDVKDEMNALYVFLVDSFAVAIASKAASETTEFIIWFEHWTQQLLNYWPENIRSDGAQLFTKFINKDEEEGKDGMGSPSKGS
jgi:hypothetical protein